MYLRVAHSAPQGQSIDTLSSLLIGLGSSIALLSFLGGCGAGCESICMLCLVSLTPSLYIVNKQTAQ